MAPRIDGSLRIPDEVGIGNERTSSVLRDAATMAKPYTVSATTELLRQIQVVQIAGDGPFGGERPRDAVFVGLLDADAVRCRVEYRRECIFLWRVARQTHPHAADTAQSANATATPA